MFLHRHAEEMVREVLRVVHVPDPPHWQGHEVLILVSILRTIHCEHEPQMPVDVIIGRRQAWLHPFTQQLGALGEQFVGRPSCHLYVIKHLSLIHI